ncbi:MAG: dTDP-4-dehydrorhamnose 3,5-epimerase, partial [Deltaproteobacteria bacterium]|nr:dTDP-4-dehydrorhamnose 3,5-epimerase [Deltaproteobacteria bacterium]
HGVELSKDNFKAFFIPKGCAHGYYTIVDNSELMYFVSFPYTPNLEGGIAWDDPFLNINWPGVPKIISDKDKSWPAHDWKL